MAKIEGNLQHSKVLFLRICMELYMQPYNHPHVDNSHPKLLATDYLRRTVSNSRPSKLG